jgi:exoribonuclease-2
METGNIVEFIDSQKILCAVVLEVKRERLRLLTETNRELTLAANRLLYKGGKHIDLSIGRDKAINCLKDTAKTRNALISLIDIKELWEVLNSEQEWIDLATMTEFCFPENPTNDHQSAVLRAFFHNRLYFKFNKDHFYPNTKEMVDQKAEQEKQNALNKKIIANSVNWLKTILNNSDKPARPFSYEHLETINILKTTYLCGNESNDYVLGKEILDKAGIKTLDELFHILVRLDVFDENENFDLYLYNIPTKFQDKVVHHAACLVDLGTSFSDYGKYKDFTNLSIMTIDGQATLDYDDGLSIEDREDHYRLGIHIADVAHYIKKGDILDQEALSRGSSIYMPDSLIPMLPPGIAEGLCSLRLGELKPAISVMVKLSRSFDILEHSICASIIRVEKQLTYFDVNLMAEVNKEIVLLYKIAKKFRMYRLDHGAIQIFLPNISVWINEHGEINVNQMNRESPSRMLVSEIMIMANWLMARFLSDKGMPAIYRSQAEPQERLFNGDEGTLFENYMQRRLLSRFMLNYKPSYHSGLGLNEYVTATSPIRKYYDLATQRQIRALLGIEEPSSCEDMENIIQMAHKPVSNATLIQRSRNRYWVLKYLEKRIGEKTEALVLYKRKNDCQILLPAYMLQCSLPVSSGINLKSEDVIRVSIQHANARKNLISVVM